MAFTLIGTTSTSVISLPVREALLASIERCGRAVLLVDTLDTKKTVQKLLAADPVLSLGLTVSTLLSGRKNFGDSLVTDALLFQGNCESYVSLRRLRALNLAHLIHCAPVPEWLRQLSNLPKVIFIVLKIKGHGSILLWGKSGCLPSWIDILN